MSEHSSSPKVRAIIALLIISLASACASGAKTRPNDAPVVANPGVMWEDGLKAVDTGEALLTKGEKRLALGRQQVRDGEAKIREGSERVAKAKLEYEQAASVVGASTASDKQKQASTLRPIGMRWEAAIQEIKDGNKLVAKGNANINRGESEIREGGLLMETGSILIRNAHRSRLGQSLLPLPTS